MEYREGQLGRPILISIRQDLMQSLQFICKAVPLTIKIS